MIIPGMDGLEVAANYRSSAGQAKQPRFIAVTADMKGLLAHAENCENFDQIVRKPFDLSEICRVVEAPQPGARPSAAPSPEPPIAWTKAVHPRQRREDAGEQLPAPSSHERHEPWAIQELGYRFLHCPEDLSNPRRALEAQRYDAVLVHSSVTDAQLNPLWQVRSLQTLPIIDLTGSLGTQADLNPPSSTPQMPTPSNAWSRIFVTGGNASITISS